MALIVASVPEFTIRTFCTDGSAWQLRCKGAVLGIEESLWVDAKGGPRLTGQIVLSGEAGASGATVTWLLRRSR